MRALTLVAMMADVTVNQKQLLRLEKSLAKAGKDFGKGKKKLLKKIGVLVQGLAMKYCPESPTKSQYASMNKSGKTSRKSSGITTGSLRDSITHEVGKDFVSINVPSNSRGGKYAEKMHDKKGSEWLNRGPRTKQKGAKADEKFIFRAGKDTQKETDALIDQVLNEMIKGIGV
jgi:hypothetical protein